MARGVKSVDVSDLPDLLTTVFTATSEPVCGAVRCGRSVGRSCIDVLLLQSSYSDATVKHIVILRV